jgi:hypothetical protein
LKPYIFQSIFKKTLIHLFLILSLVACGGGGGGDNSTNPPPVEVAPPVETVKDNTGSITGVVINVSGEPVEGASVYLAGFEVITDETGSYYFSDVPIPEGQGNYAVTIISANYGSIVVEVSPSNQTNNTENSTSFIPEFEAEAPEAQLGGHGSIDGIVLDENGIPMVGVEVTIKRTATNDIVDYMLVVITDASGYYIFSDVPFSASQNSFIVQTSTSETDMVAIEVLPIHQVQNTGGQDTTPIDNTSFIDDFIAQAPIIILEQNNTTPVANAGSYQIVKLGDTVYLDGTASFDSDGDNITYSWSNRVSDQGFPLPSGGEGSLPEGESPLLNAFGIIIGWPIHDAELENNTSATPHFVATELGEYQIYLIVTDGKNNSQISTVEIDVVQENTPPIANAGDDSSILINNEVILDGSLSTDTNNDLLTYFWSFSSIPNSSSAVLLNELTETPSFTPDVSGEYVISLTVNDGDVSSVVDSVVVFAEAESIKLFANGFFSEWSEVAIPYSMSGVATGSIIGVPYYEVSKFKLTAAGKDFVIRNLSATDANLVVAPYFDGLRNGQIIADGTTVEFSLRSPLTRNVQANLNFYFSIEGTNKTFSYSVLLQTN